MKHLAFHVLQLH